MDKAYLKQNYTSIHFGLICSLSGVGETTLKKINKRIGPARTHPIARDQ